MRFYSTRNYTHQAGFCEAIRDGLAPDGGLYFPISIPTLSPDRIKELAGLSLAEIASEVLFPFAEGEIGHEEFTHAMQRALDFSVPIVEVSPGIHVLELFHGPTLAFKDVGARCMGQLLPFCIDSGKPITVLVATSGDTGSAVAHGFHNVEGVRVVVLYPRGKVSEFQERQMATLGGNVHAVSVNGTFDDCQGLVKWAFLDPALRQNLTLTSANSINIARWLPQCLYYFLVAGISNDPVVAIPSGNFGNFTAGVLAYRMGLRVKHLIAACNANDIVPQYLEHGEFLPRPSIKTIANAMDVGNPSNFERLTALFPDESEMHRLISGVAYRDAGIRQAIRTCYESTGYLLDPHGATAYQALVERGEGGIFLATAHPGKFGEVYPVLGLTADLPGSARENQLLPLLNTTMDATPESLRALLMSL